LSHTNSSLNEVDIADFCEGDTSSDDDSLGSFNPNRNKNLNNFEENEEEEGSSNGQFSFDENHSYFEEKGV
jgi:hypothetical protein